MRASEKDTLLAWDTVAKRQAQEKATLQDFIHELEVKLATEKELRQGETSHLHYQKTCLQAEKEDLQVRQRGGRPRSGVPYHGFNLKWFIGCC